LTVHDGTARTWANSFSNYVKQKKKKKKEKKKKKKKKKKEKKKEVVLARPPSPSTYPLGLSP